MNVILTPMLVMSLACNLLSAAFGTEPLPDTAPHPAESSAAAMASPVDFPQAFHVEGNMIVNAAGDEMIFRGVNTTDPLAAAFDLDDVSYLRPDEEYYRTIHAWGANTIRVPIQPGAWRTHGEAASLTVLDNVVELAARYGLYVILDYHAIGWVPTAEYEQPPAGESEYEEVYDTSEAELVSFWDVISKRYAADDAVVFYDLFNEPVYAGFMTDNETPDWERDWLVWKQLAEKLTDTIRANDPDAIIIVGGLNWSYDLRYAAKYPVEREDIVYATHIYPNVSQNGTWEGMFGELRRQYPVFAAEVGFGHSRSESEYGGPGRFRDDLKTYLDDNRMSWTAWVFSYIWDPYLLSDEQYTPTEAGAFFKHWLQSPVGAPMETLDHEIEDASPVPAPPEADEPAGRLEFVRRRGNRLIAGEADQVVWLRGINLDNQWFITPSGDWTLDDDYEGVGSPIPDRYGEEDFQRIAAMGMNVIRFNLNYQIFEDKDNPYVYKPEGWAWLDQNIEWARANGLYLILDMVVPPGGYQPGGGVGAELWDDPERAGRYIALWQAIAERYSDEPVIAGYDLLNEPTPTETAGQWEQLANETIAAIREVDPNHLIVLEPVNWIVNADGESPDAESIDYSAFQFLAPDDNVMYDFHFYVPFEYTHQLTPWTSREDGGKYPDESVVYESHDGSIIGVRDKDFLDMALAEMAAFGQENNVPMYVGEFTPSRPTFRDGKGGLTYVEDVLDLLVKYDLHFTYYTYDGLYFDYQGRPDPLPELVELLTDFYTRSAR